MTPADALAKIRDLPWQQQIRVKSVLQFGWRPRSSEVFDDEAKQIILALSFAGRNA
ncbi:unnamed protein product [marine sediment metagenome]|uniref:Uncharacterized protein n=1 Tax=marine sediment metagenome TaxID=412755 RepID=X0S949_9ZZZZ